MYIVYMNKYTREVSILSSIQDEEVIKYIVSKLESKNSSPYKSLSIVKDISPIVSNHEVKYYYIVENFMLKYIEE